MEPENNRLLSLQSKLEEKDNQQHKLFRQQLPKLGDIHYVYHQAEIVEKQELIKLWFGRSLVWGGTYFRTTYMMDVFSHNINKMKELDLLYLIDMKMVLMKNPVSSGNGSRTRV